MTDNFIGWLVADLDNQLLTTESVNPNTSNIDSLETAEILKLMNEEDRNITKAIANVISDITKVVDAVVASIKSGGRIFFVGAGTSGRLGVLEAAECPPTFGVSSDLFQAVIAGGERAIFKSIESAEDDEEQGRADLCSRKITEKDVVIGIAASGKTPYVIGALNEAKAAKAITVALTCNPNSVIGKIADYKIEAVPGPEVISGSTRLKAGSTQKIILNMITTTAMIKVGKVYKNLMVDVSISNKKLRERGINIIKLTTGADDAVADQALEAANNNVKAAIVMIKNGVDYETAVRKLSGANGYVREAIEEDQK
ncbi:MAG: N-acetylmuramic acid 6-phosphate etherase [Tuberibacillus sp.]